MSMTRHSLVKARPTALWLFLMFSSLFTFPHATFAAATVVTNCTEAGLNAALAVGGDITFNCGGPATITVTSQKTIAQNTSIDGSNNGNQVTISGGNNVRVLYVPAGVTLTLNNIKIAKGNASGAVPEATYGGGLYNSGTIVLTYVFFDSNQATFGGGIFNAFGASATLNQVYFGFNKASYGGGGLYNEGTLLGINSGGYSNNTTDNYGAAIFFNGGTTTISYATFEGNISGGNGGAIYANNGELTISNSTSFTNNKAKRQGGAIWDGLASVLRIDKATFTGNAVTGADSASSNGDTAEGGAIYTYRNDAINISNSTFTTNSAKGGNGNGNYGGDGDGGAILHHGTGLMTITTSTFSQNTATGGNGGMNYGGDGNGGAIYADRGAMTVLTSTLSANTATGGIGYGNGSGYGNGGAIYQDANNVYTISASTFNGNVAQGGASGGYNGGNADGGAIHSSNNNKPFLINSTLYGNRAIGGAGGARYGGGAAGGGIYQFAGGDNLTIINSTITENTAVGGSGSPAGTKSGSGIYGGQSGGSGVTIANTIISGNALSANCGGVIVDGGYNLEYDNTTCGLSTTKNDQSGDPKLGPLTNNGGTTQTKALQVGSAAIDTGDDSVCAAARVNNLDQRGFTRPFGAHCDIGAYEFSAPTVTTSFAPASIGSGGTTALAFTLDNLSGVAVTGVGFSATLPSQVSLKNTPTSDCGGTVNVGANVITVSGISMAVAASCAITADVTASTPGTYFTTTGPLASTQFGAVGAGNTTTLTVNGPAATVIQAGDGQTAQVNTPFATALQAKVTDSDGNPIVGASVTFFAPGGGASCVFAGGGGSSTATTDADGVATALRCTANATAGTYTVQATTPGVATPVSFSLTNSLTAPTPTPDPTMPTPAPGPENRKVYLPLTMR